MKQPLMRCVLAGVLLGSFGVGEAGAQVNSWASGGSGKWETGSKWSLGVPPTVAQSLFITNVVVPASDLQKDITINADTVLSNAINGCMSVGTLTVSAPGLFRNTLFLNNAGLATPLVVTNGLTLTSRASVVITNSVLRFNENFTHNNSLIVGTVASGLSQVRVVDGQLSMGENCSLLIGSGGLGEMSVTNSSLFLFDIVVGSGVGGTGTLTMDGGAISVSNALQVGFISGGTGTVWETGGTINAVTLDIGAFGVGQLILSNGTLNTTFTTVGDSTGSSGTLTLAAGSLTAKRFALGFNVGTTGALWMTGGQLIATNALFFSVVGGSGQGAMTVSNGSVAINRMVLGADFTGSGSLTMNGGTASVYSNLTLGALGVCGATAVTVAGGSLFVTNAAHNAVLEVIRGTLTLSAGTLSVDKIVLTNSCTDFTRTGGTLTYSNAVLIATRDDDGDGIPNGYEQSHGLDPLNAADANVDSDGDGLSNLQEFFAGTDATNSASAFRITSVIRTNNDVRITWRMGPGRTNALQRTSGDAGSFSTNNFAAIFTVTNTVGTVTNYLDLGAATNFPSLYYRVRLVP